MSSFFLDSLYIKNKSNARQRLSIKSLGHNMLIFLNGELLGKGKFPSNPLFFLLIRCAKMSRDAKMRGSYLTVCETMYWPGNGYGSYDLPNFQLQLHVDLKEGKNELSLLSTTVGLKVRLSLRSRWFLTYQ